MEDDELSHFFLEDLRPEDFRITSMSGTYDRRDDVDDFDTYSECKEGTFLIYPPTYSFSHLQQTTLTYSNVAINK